MTVRAAQLSLSARFPWRAVVFTAVVLLLLGSPIYIYLNAIYGPWVPTKYLPVDLKSLEALELDPTEGVIGDIPARIRALDGQRVTLRGEIYAPKDGANGRSFQLVYSLSGNHHRAPRVQERVFVTISKGKSFRWAGEGNHEVLGTLHVGVKKDEKGGMIMEVYRMEADSVKPVTEAMK